MENITITNRMLRGLLNNITCFRKLSANNLGLNIWIIGIILEPLSEKKYLTLAIEFVLLEGLLDTDPRIDPYK